MSRKKRLTPVNPYALAKIIQTRGLKRYWVAMQLGVERSTVRRWCNGITPSMNIDTFRRLQDLLGFDTIEWGEKPPRDEPRGPYRTKLGLQEYRQRFQPSRLRQQASQRGVSQG